MANEIDLYGGTLNKVWLDQSNQVVIKEFEVGNGVIVPRQQRLLSEIISLQKIPVSPKLLGYDPNRLFMSFIEGEKNLDQLVEDFPTQLQEIIYMTAGSILAAIHDVRRGVITDSYHYWHRQKYIHLIDETAPRLVDKGIDGELMKRFLDESYNLEKIKISGLVWTHGDYWLSNLVGELKKNTFRLNGVIDWELAGFNSPYADFAIVGMSIETNHPNSSELFWKGYGKKPDPWLQLHYSLVKTLEWISGEEAENKLDSDFYESKLQMIRSVL